MLIAQKLKQENIAEYILYMWQIEDILRANRLDIEKIDEQIISKFEQTQEVRANIRIWYEGLIEMMRTENKIESGHLLINENIMLELTNIHNSLLKKPTETDYVSIYYKTLPFIVELRTKSTDKAIPELETCFAAVYGFLLMRLKGQSISGETQAAITQISSLLRLLSEKYKEFCEGKFELNY